MGLSARKKPFANYATKCNNYCGRGLPIRYNNANMKPSQYNYCMSFGANTVFFNGVSEAFFFASPAHAEVYKSY